jgi:small subunit ribosomal protein S6
MKHDKHLYETTCIINASLEDTQIESTITHIADVIARNGGEITATNRWGRKRLAYPIEKKNNGYYINFEFLAGGTTNAQLERTYILDENILRFLTIQLNKKALASRRQASAAAAAAAAAAPPPAAPGSVPPAAPAPASAPAAVPASAATPVATEPAKAPLFSNEASAPSRS